MTETRFTAISIVLAAVALSAAQPSSSLAENADACSGHQFLQTPRAEDSCLTIRPSVFASPDQALRAYVFPADVDLHVTPDMESRVVIRGADAKLLSSKDHSSPRGANGYYVVRAGWSPDAQFFVYSMASSGGHSPWRFPTWVYSRQTNAFVDLSAMIGGNPIMTDAFTFSGPHTIAATTWEKSGSENQIPVTVDLEAGLARLPPPAGK